MERVLGIGGFFYRASDPDGLGRWYEELLGAPRPPVTYDEAVWQQDAGPTAWVAIGTDDHSMLSPAQRWSINSRVRDLASEVAQ